MAPAAGCRGDRPHPRNALAGAGGLFLFIAAVAAAVLDRHDGAVPRDVADVVEAMSSHRPYRAALGLDRALAEITNNRGAHYCPDVVDACVALFASGRFQFALEEGPA